MKSPFHLTKGLVFFTLYVPIGAIRAGRPFTKYQHSLFLESINLCSELSDRTPRRHRRRRLQETLQRKNHRHARGAA